MKTRLSGSLGAARAFDKNVTHVIGVLTGEGVGVEVVPVAMRLLDVLRAHSSRRFDIRTGGLIGYPAEEVCGSGLSPEVIDFSADIFKHNGALFCGPGGGRFVYEMRRAFDLYCKFTPIEPLPELRTAGVVRPETVAGADIIIVRENSGGIYQGEWGVMNDPDGGSIAYHRFSYTDKAVQRILETAMTLAATRRGRVHAVLKPGGVPSISKQWRGIAEELAKAHGVEFFEHEVDNAVYQLIANPAQYDVIVTPNMFGDVVGDCGSLLLASRGLSYSGNFSGKGNGVYQTAHGAARDIAGKNIANPIGQILSLGMMLRESFDWPEADAALRQAVRATLKEGLCTRDIAMPGHKVVGTDAFSNAITHNLEVILGREYETSLAVG